METETSGDPDLRAEVQRLLDANEGAGSFMQKPFINELVIGDFFSACAISSDDCLAATDTVNRVASSSRASGRVLPAAIGRYRILEFVGEGGMAVVYKAEQQEPRRVVALKIIKPGLAGPEYEKRFEREKDALARMNHDDIARIYDAGTADTGSGPQPYFAMEFIAQGQPLTAYAENEGLKARQRLELMAQVCDAVHYAHQHFIIHRDLKPSNILVDERGRPKILDFGVARITDNDVGTTRQTDTGQLVGTLEYMSPEQAVGDPKELDTRSDVYALGVILYELLAGNRPYDLRYKTPFDQCVRSHSGFP